MIFKFNFNSSTFFKPAILFLSQRCFHFFYITKASLHYITKKVSLYIENINSNIINNLAILTFGFLLINIDSFIFILTIAFYCLSVKLVWFGYRIYSLRSMILTTNIN